MEVGALWYIFFHRIFLFWLMESVRFRGILVQGSCDMTPVMRYYGKKKGEIIKYYEKNYRHKTQKAAPDCPIP